MACFSACPFPAQFMVCMSVCPNSSQVKYDQKRSLQICCLFFPVEDICHVCSSPQHQCSHMDGSQHGRAIWYFPSQ